MFDIGNTLTVEDEKLSMRTKINRQSLDDRFFHGLRNELTERRLNDLSRLACKIEKPKLFGEFNSDQHYLQTVDLFSKATHEGRHRGAFFLRTVLPMVQCKSNLLDIGHGNGRLTKLLSRGFERLTVVDPSDDALDNINFEKFRHSIEVEKICCYIQDTVLRDNYYDLSVLSHMLYHIPRDEWLDVIKHVYLLTKKGGMIAIVINGGLDRSGIVRNFDGTLLDVDAFIQELLGCFTSKVQCFVSDEQFATHDVLSMLFIAGVHLADAGVSVVLIGR